MKIYAGISVWLIFIAGISLFNITDSRALTDTAYELRHINGADFRNLDQQDPTPPPEVAGENSTIELPIAHNPGLVFGAVILVIIIIGGVIINSRLLKKKK